MQHCFRTIGGSKSARRKFSLGDTARSVAAHSAFAQSQFTMRVIIAAFFAVGQCVAATQGDATPLWQPNAPSYAYAVTKNVPARMDDGIVLSSDIYYPTDSTTGMRSPDSFPVLLEQTPYGKDLGAAG